MDGESTLTGLENISQSNKDVLLQIRRNYEFQCNRVLHLIEEGYTIHTSDDPPLEGYDNVATVGGALYMFWKPQPRRINANRNASAESSGTETGGEIPQEEQVDN